jgi:hypothetical protein
MLQAQRELWAFEAERAQRAAAAALGDVALCRRMLLRWREGAWQSRSWQEEKKRLATLGVVRHAAWALRRFRQAAGASRGVRVLVMRRERRVARAVLGAWRAVIESRCGGKGLQRGYDLCCLRAQIATACNYRH